MSERIDHAAEAKKILEDLEPHRGQNLELDSQLVQAHATLALVEQQRIANMIALFAAPNTESLFDEYEWSDITGEIVGGLGL